MSADSPTEQPLSEAALGRALEVLPHRPPFLLLDRALEIIPGERGRAAKLVTGNEPYVSGSPALMGALVVEACAQLMAVVAAAVPEGTQEVGGEDGDGEERARPRQTSQPGYLVALEGFRLRRPVAAGDRLVLEAVLGRRMGPLLQAAVRAEIEGQEVAAGKITVSSPR